VKSNPMYVGQSPMEVASTEDLNILKGTLDSPP